MVASASMVGAVLTSSAVIVALGALRKPLCHLLGGLVVERGQRVEDAAR